MGNRVINHGRKIAAALALVQSGAVDSKKEAAQLVGIGETSLAPSRLSHELTNGANGRPVQSGQLLEVSVEVLRDGKTVQVTAREIFSTGAKVALQSLHELAPLVRKLTPKQRQQAADARQWLKMCREFDLFPSDSKPSAPDPGEVQQISKAKERKGSAAHFIAQRRGSGADSSEASERDQGTKQGE